MSRITDYVLEPNIVYTNGSFLIKVKVQDSYKYKKYLVSENIKYKTISGTTFTLTDVKQGQPGSILQLQGNTTQNGTPTPTSPVEVKTVSGDNEVVVQNKNLFNMAFYNYGGLITNPLYNSTRLFTVHGIRVKPNIEYTVSTTLDTTQFKYGVWLATQDFPLYNTTQRYFDSGWNWTSKRTVTATQGGYLGIIVSTSNGTDTLSPSDIEGVTWQVEEGSTATTYIAHSENTYNINFGYTNPIPNTYQEVEYIEANGTQYIDTGFKPCMNKTRVVCDMIPTNDGDNAFFGSRGTFYMFYKVSGNYFWPISQATTVSGTMAVGNKYHIDWNKGRFIATGNDGVYQVKATSNNTQDNSSMYLFTFNPVDNRKANAKLYNFKIYYDDILVREFIPCYRKSDNEVGLYDTVGGTFYTNIGTGTFGKGADKNTQSIELCKIGNYVDKLKRAEGKQLFDSSIIVGATKNNVVLTNENGIKLTGTANANTSFSYLYKLSQSLLGKTLTLKVFGDMTGLYNVGFKKSGSNKVVVTPSSPTTTFTVTQELLDDINSFDIFMANNSTLKANIYIMLEENTQATFYEPYGNVWYIEKNIEKLILNKANLSGITYCNINTPWDTQNEGYIHYQFPQFLVKYGEGDIIMIADDRFPSVDIAHRNLKAEQIFAHYTNGVVSITIAASRLNGISSSSTTNEKRDAFNTWLNANPVTIYYVKTTPTYEIITNETLIEQLNNIQDLELQPDLCYIDWIGSESPTMLLQYGSTEILNANIITEDGKKIRTDWGI